MGYYSRFSLQWQPEDPFDATVGPHDDLFNEVVKKMPEKALELFALANLAPTLDQQIGITISKDEGASTALSPTGSSLGSVKWYEFNEFMSELSRELPHIVFELHGEGEDPGDVWNDYWLNGKVHREVAQMQIAPFDKNKLQPYDPEAC